jgi:hypothetical protein
MSETAGFASTRRPSAETKAQPSVPDVKIAPIRSMSARISPSDFMGFLEDFGASIRSGTSS